jgi:hypothetical protein
MCYRGLMLHANIRRNPFIADRIEDMHAPINVDAYIGTMPIAMKERIAFLLSERHLHGRRTKIRVSFESYCRSGGRAMDYARLPSAHVYLDCPTPAQAKAAIKLIQKVCASLQGKWLVEEEPPSI